MAWVYERLCDALLGFMRLLAFIDEPLHQVGFDTTQDGEESMPICGGSRLIYL